MVYRTADWQEQWRYEDETFYTDVTAFSPDGKRFAVMANLMKKARVLDVATGRKLYECVIESECSRRNVVFSPDGKQLMSTYRGENPHLWDAETGRLIRRLVISTDPKTGTGNTAFLSNEEVIVVRGAGWDSIIINVRNNASRVWPGEFMALSADRRVAAIRDPERQLLIFRSPATGEVLAETQEKIHWGGGHSCFSADGTVFTAFDTELRLKIWELQFTAPDTEGLNPSNGTMTDGTAAAGVSPE